MSADIHFKSPITTEVIQLLTCRLITNQIGLCNFYKLSMSFRVTLLAAVEVRQRFDTLNGNKKLEVAVAHKLKVANQKQKLQSYESETEASNRKPKAEASTLRVIPNSTDQLQMRFHILCIKETMKLTAYSSRSYQLKLFERCSCTNKSPNDLFVVSRVNLHQLLSKIAPQKHDKPDKNSLHGCLTVN